MERCSQIFKTPRKSDWDGPCKLNVVWRSKDEKLSYFKGPANAGGLLQFDVTCADGGMSRFGGGLLLEA
jgi:hypothetical protein